MKTSSSYIVRTATSQDEKYIPGIIQEIALSAAQRKVAKGYRSKAFIADKINKGYAVIAIHPQTKEWMGFSYIEVWQHKKYLATSGLIVAPKYRGLGLSKDIKAALFSRSRTCFPNAKLLSITSSPAVIHVNTDLGYKKVPFQHVIDDYWFQEGRNCWIDYQEIMEQKEKAQHYVAMIFEP